MTVVTCNFNLELLVQKLLTGYLLSVEPNGTVYVQ